MAIGAAALLLLARPAAARVPTPGFELVRGEVLFAKMLPAIFADKAVAPQLKNGLTTTFAISVKAHDFVGREIAGSAQIEVRYELWDEVFLVEGRGADGHRLAESFPSLERLAAWWQGLKIPVLDARGLSWAGPWKLEVTLGVIPFSRAEQSDTQRWLNRSLRTPAGKAAGAGTGVLDLLVATSIQRKSYLHYDWVVPFLPER